MSRIFVIVAIVAIIISTNGCTSQNIEGKYTSVEHPTDYIVFKNDGTYIVHKDPARGGVFGGQYHIDENTIHILVPFGSTTLTVKSKNTLVGSNGSVWIKK
jgi:hypothetical protein